MAIEQNTEGLYDVVINEETYSFSKWGAEESLSNLIKISKIVGKPLGILLGNALGNSEPEGLFGEEKGILSKEFKPDMLALALEALTNNMDEKSMIPIIKSVVSKDVFCNGAKINFNTHYGSNLMLMFKVLKAGLEVQYGNFFDEFRDLMPVKKSVISNQAPIM